MKLVQRITVALIGTLVSSAAALASDYPNGSIEFIVPFNPGGQTDIASRVMADALAEELGVNVSVVNRDGAGGAVGSAEIAAAVPDGYRIGVSTSSPLLMRPHRTETPYNVDSYDYVCRVYYNPLLLVVKDESPYLSIDDLIEDARSGTRIAYGSVGAGSLHHIAMELLVAQGDFEAVQVQSTSDATNVRNLLADVTNIYFLSSSVYRQNADVLRPLAVMNNERMPSYPDVPAIAESGYQVVAENWGAMVTPKGTTAGVLERLRDACEKAQATERFQERMMELGMDPVYLNGLDTEILVKEQSATFGAIISDLGLED